MSESPRGHSVIINFTDQVQSKSFSNFSLSFTYICTIILSWIIKSFSIYCNKFQVQIVWYHYFDAQENFNSIPCYVGAYVWMTGFGNLVIDYVSACELGTLLKNSLNGNLFCYVCCYICFGNYSQARKSKAFDSLK